MSMTEVRNMTARCLDTASNAALVLHEVGYELKDSGGWIDKTVQLLATDPIDAINAVRKREGV